MRLSVSRHAEGLQAAIAIDRLGGVVETLPLAPVPSNHHLFESETALAEPHEFEAELSLAAGERHKVLPFRMKEPPDMGPGATSPGECLPQRGHPISLDDHSPSIADTA
jgi:hypothetical protein